jgi:hypothetical protein
MKPYFKDSYHDDLYCESVEKWENEIMPGRLSAKRFQWFVNLLPAFLIAGVFVAGNSWRLWIALAACVYVIVKAFTFFEEVNENLRYVRHQLRTFRAGVRAVSDEVSKHRDRGPERNVTIPDFLESLNREWEDPT